MTGRSGPFRPDEVRGADVPAADGELAAASAMARDLETVTSEDVHPDQGFVDRVMAAVASEPRPQPLGILEPVRREPTPHGFLVSIRGAWATAVRGLGRPFAARALALAYVLVIVVAGTSLTSAAAIGAASAIGILGPARTPAPTHLGPVPSVDATSEPTEPGESAGPGDTGEPGESGAPGASAEPGESAEPGASEDGGSPSPHGSVEPSSSGSAPTSSPSGSDDHETPHPTDTPRPTETPRPTSTSGG